MSNQHPYQSIWENSYNLSKSFWDLYRRHIGAVTFAYDLSTTERLESVVRDQKPQSDEQPPDEVTHRPQEVIKDVNAEYLEFIRITRKHQKERERLKQIELAKKPHIEEYYKDISQVNTVVEDNLVEAPKKDIPSNPQQKVEKLIELYGGQDNYEHIRSLEMVIDEHFKKKMIESSPKYWPAMPLNPGVYLNPL